MYSTIIYLLNMNTNQLKNAAKQKLSQATDERDRALNLHEQAKTERELAFEFLTKERNKLEICKTNQQKQIQVKNAAKITVNQQNVVVQNDIAHLKDVQHQLNTARENQTQQANKVNQIQVQVREKQYPIAQLNAEKEVLQLRQKQTQDELKQVDIDLQRAEQGHENAKTVLKNLQEQYQTKIDQIKDTNELFQSKQNQFEQGEIGV